jgi:hypothetical protein
LASELQQTFDCPNDVHFGCSGRQFRITFRDEAPAEFSLMIRNRLPEMTTGKRSKSPENLPVGLDRVVKARVVELRFFGGLSVEETTEVLAVSPETVMRDWKFARSWLHAELSNG